MAEIGKCKTNLMKMKTGCPPKTRGLRNASGELSTSGSTPSATWALWGLKLGGNEVCHKTMSPRFLVTEGDTNWHLVQKGSHEHHLCVPVKPQYLPGHTWDYNPWQGMRDQSPKPRDYRLWVIQASVQILVILGKSFHPPKSSFLICKMGLLIVAIYYIGFRKIR